MITEREAIAELRDIYNNVIEYKDERTEDAFGMAYMALERQEDLLSSGNFFDEWYERYTLNMNALNNYRNREQKYRWHDLRKEPADLPEEVDSIFVKYKGTDKWHSSMFEKRSEEVLVCFEFCDGSRIIKQTYTKDSKFKLDNFLYRESTAIAWKYIEPFEEGNAE